MCKSPRSLPLVLTLVRYAVFKCRASFLFRLVRAGGKQSPSSSTGGAWDLVEVFTPAQRAWTSTVVPTEARSYIAAVRQARAARAGKCAMQRCACRRVHVRVRPENEAAPTLP